MTKSPQGTFNRTAQKLVPEVGEHDELMIALGRLTCAWGAIEQRLFDLYASIVMSDGTVYTDLDNETGQATFRMATNQGEFIASSYGALDSNRAKRDIILATAKGQLQKGRFTKEDFDAISSIMGRVQECAKARNLFAHASLEFKESGAYYFGTRTYMDNFRGGAARQKCQPSHVDQATNKILALDKDFDLMMREVFYNIAKRLAEFRAAKLGGLAIPARYPPS